MDWFDVIWKLAVILLLLSIGGSLGVMAQAFKAQADAFVAQQQEG